ncbi:40S ribosomal protein S3a-like [Papaver somniferum]|uniref:40S ribosomal protein S3a-like n=1 Tax=Papaver somniferum TaxID=3469 RepID=UPI000E700E8B|nr:40S ribosomal protein S3a-like [Papaver somniferum]
MDKAEVLLLIDTVAAEMSYEECRVDMLVPWRGSYDVSIDSASSGLAEMKLKPFGRLWWDDIVSTVVGRSEIHNQIPFADTLRMFCIGFNKRREKQVKRTCNAQSSQIRQLELYISISMIRRKLVEVMVNQASSCDLKELVAKFIPEMIGKEIEKATSSIYLLQNVFIRKFKILKALKFDLGKLMEVHGDYSEDVGVKVDRPAEETVPEAETEVVGA